MKRYPAMGFHYYPKLCYANLREELTKMPMIQEKTQFRHLIREDDFVILPRQLNHLLNHMHELISFGKQ